MGEQREPTGEEVERALKSVLAVFLSGSDKIADKVEFVQDHLMDVPVEERDDIDAAIGHILSTQANLKARMESLPAPAWDRFKAAVSVVRLQQLVLGHLEQIVTRHVLPRQPEPLLIAALPAPRHQSSPATRPPSFKPAPRQEQPVRAHRNRQALVARRSRDEIEHEDEDDERRSLLAVAREHIAGFRGLAAMVAAAVVLSLIPRDVNLHELAARLVARVGDGFSVAQSEPPDAPRGAEQPPLRQQGVDVPRTVEGPPPPHASAIDRTAAVPAMPSDQRRTTAPAPTLVPPDTAKPPDPPALPQPSERPSVQPTEKIAVAPAVDSAPAEPPAGLAEEQFVPVLFTHKDQKRVMRAMAELKERYPDLLLDRTGEVQPVDLGKKGIWHRLVFLPAGPRPEASKLCALLMSEGYDRCWVKAY
jgi:hypothetical protein